MHTNPITNALRIAVKRYLRDGGTLNALAVESNINAATLHRWWHEQRDVRASTLDALCSVLKLQLRKVGQ